MPECNHNLLIFTFNKVVCMGGKRSGAKYSYEK